MGYKCFSVITNGDKCGECIKLMTEL